jgi:hypothetical protein
VILMTKRSDELDRTIVRWAHTEAIDISKNFPFTQEQAFIHPSTVPGEQELLHTELSVLLRWEDDGGRSI